VEGNAGRGKERGKGKGDREERRVGRRRKEGWIFETWLLQD